MPPAPRRTLPRCPRPTALATTLLASILVLSTATSGGAQESGNRWLSSGEDGWLLAAGAFDTAATRQDAELTVGYSLPYRLFPGRWFELQPEVGLTVTDEGGGWLWFAFLWSLEVSERWTIIPYTGGTLYERGDGKELGGIVEFRSGIEANYRLASGRRVGLSFYHLSNADLYDSNPGANSLVVTFRW